MRLLCGGTSGSAHHTGMYGFKGSSCRLAAGALVLQYEAVVLLTCMYASCWEIGRAYNCAVYFIYMETNVQDPQRALSAQRSRRAWDTAESAKLMEPAV